MAQQPLTLQTFTIASRLPPAAVTALLNSRVAGRLSMAQESAYSVEVLFRKLSGEPIPLWFSGTVGPETFLLQRLSGRARRSDPVLSGSIHEFGCASLLMFAPASSGQRRWPFLLGPSSSSALTRRV